MIFCNFRPVAEFDSQGLYSLSLDKLRCFRESDAASHNVPALIVPTSSCGQLLLQRNNQDDLSGWALLSVHLGGAPNRLAIKPTKPGERPKVSHAAYLGFPPNQEWTRCAEGSERSGTVRSLPSTRSFENSFLNVAANT